MPVVNNLTQLYPVSFIGAKGGIEHDTGRPICTVLSGNWDPVSRMVTLNLSDGRTVNYSDIDQNSWLQVKFLAGI